LGAAENDVVIIGVCGGAAEAMEEHAVDFCKSLFLHAHLGWNIRTIV
jgi:hypothetical protein